MLRVGVGVLPLVLMVVGTGAGSVRANPEGQGAARMEFVRAIQLAERSRHLRFSERFNYQVSQVTGSYEMEAIRGGRFRASWALLSPVNGRLRPLEGPVKSGGTSGDTLLQAILLNLLVPGITLVAPHPDIRLLTLEEYRVTTVRFATQAARSTTIVVHGRGYPWQCAIRCGAFPFIAQRRISQWYAYTGKLVIDARTGLPVRYSSTVRFLKHRSTGQSAAFTYLSH